MKNYTFLLGASPPASMEGMPGRARPNAYWMGVSPDVEGTAQHTTIARNRSTKAYLNEYLAYQVYISDKYGNGGLLESLNPIGGIEDVDLGPMPCAPKDQKKANKMCANFCRSQGMCLAQCAAELRHGECDVTVTCVECPEEDNNLEFETNSENNDWPEI